MLGGVTQSSGAVTDPIEIAPHPSQPPPGGKPILNDRDVEPAPTCGPRNPVLGALCSLGRLLSRAFVAVMPCGARRDSALTPERAAERSRKQLARTLSLAAGTQAKLGTELHKLAEAHRRWIEVDPAHAETRFDEMVETLVNVLPLWRDERDDEGVLKPDKGAGKLVETLSSSQAIIDCRKDLRARGDIASEAMLERLEVAVARALNGRERRALLASVREAVNGKFGTAIELIGAREVDGALARQKLLEAVRDARARCVELKEHGVIADVDAALRDFMDSAVSDFGRILGARAKLGEGLRVLQLLRELRESLSSGGDPQAQALADAEDMRRRLENYLTAPIFRHEDRICRVNFEAAIEAFGSAGEVDGEQLKRNFLEAARDARARFTKLQEQGLIDFDEEGVGSFQHFFNDRICPTLRSLLITLAAEGEGLRALRLLRELRESPPADPDGRYAQALADTEYMRGELEYRLPDYSRSREFNITRMSYLEIEIARPKLTRPGFQRRLEIAARDGLERCRKLKEQGLISDPEETLRARMPAFVQAAMPVGSPAWLRVTQHDPGPRVVPPGKQPVLDNRNKER